MKSSLCVVNGSCEVSFKIVGLIFVTALLWLNTFANAQTSNGVNTSSPADWTQFLRDNMQRWNPYETALRVDNVGNLQLKWTQTDKSSLADYRNPVVANVVVYVGGGNDSHLYAIDAATGQNLWSFNAAGFSVH